MTKLCNKNYQSSFEKPEFFNSEHSGRWWPLSHVSNEQLVASVFLLIPTAGLLTCSRILGVRDKYVWGLIFMSHPELDHPQGSNWLRTRCPHLLCLQGIHPVGILLGFMLFSVAPWTAPVPCLDDNSVYMVLSIQPFNGAFIKCWVNCFHVLSECWHIKLWHGVLPLVWSASQNLASAVLLWLQQRLTVLPCLLLTPRTTAMESLCLTSLGWATGV